MANPPAPRRFSSLYSIPHRLFDITPLFSSILKGYFFISMLKTFFHTMWDSNLHHSIQQMGLRWDIISRHCTVCSSMAACIGHWPGTPKEGSSSPSQSNHFPSVSIILQVYIFIISLCYTRMVDQYILCNTMIIMIEYD